MVTSPAATATATATATGRVLIIGATGFIGKFVAEASLATAHPTYLLVRPGPITPSKNATIKSFQEKGAIVIRVSQHKKLYLNLILKRICGDSFVWMLSCVVCL